MARTLSTAIIGLGSRGLSVFERIVTLAKKAGPWLGEVEVHIIDPRCDGAGVHDTGQPDYLLLNTTCSQVSMFPDSHTVGTDVDGPGPSLYQWVIERGLRVGADGFTVGSSGRPIRPTDFLPRRVLGEYLGWFLAQVLARAPGNVRVTMHRADAIDISSEPDGSLSITLSDGGRVPTGYAFLTTGYTPNAAALLGAPPATSRVIAEPYPLPERLACVAAGQSVAIGGFGLSAMDMMSCLTVGRGGRFINTGRPVDAGPLADTGPLADAPRLTYLPSGSEPTILLYSRSGVPCRARPLVTEFAARYEPLVLTRTAVDSLRTARGGRLDFDADVLPLLYTEMRIAYRRCEARCAGGEAERKLLHEFAIAEAEPGIDAVLDEMDDRLGRFDAPATLDGAAGMARSDHTAYQTWLADTLRRDLTEGVLGFAGSPVKAALDILRDMRDSIRYIVDFGGLTDHSLEAFNSTTIPLMNRAVVGPQYERHAELLALIDAGVARIPFGPAPTVTWAPEANRWRVTSTRLDVPYEEDVDWLAAAHVRMPGVESSASPLIGALHGKGWITPYRPGSGQVTGIDVDRDQHPVGIDGHSARLLWVLGPLCEGATFYNNLVPSPNAHSRPVFDAHRCVVAMFAAAQHPPAVAVAGSGHRTA